MPKINKKTLFLSQIKIIFESISLNAKLFNIVEPSPTNKEQWSKVLGITANNVRIKSFSKLDGTKNEKLRGNKL